MASAGLSGAPASEGTAAGSTPALLYVTVKGSVGRSAAGTNPDTAIPSTAAWQQWGIPYSDLAGVDLSRVAAMVIGVGNRTSPAARGSGIVYIDGISCGKPLLDQ